MTSRRVLKAAEAIREVVSTTILVELQDPRIQDVTVTYVEVSPDMRQAKVHVSVMGDEAKQRLTLHGLKSAAGYLQSKIAARIDTRYTPRLQFILDQGVKHSIEVSRILSELFPNQTESADPSVEANSGKESAAANESEDNESDADDLDADDLDADDLDADDLDADDSDADQTEDEKA